MCDTLDLLKQNFSEKRLSTYEKLAEKKKLDINEAVKLYKYNILICEELYAFFSCIEVCLRNKIHNKMKEIKCKDDWYNEVDWLEIHAKGLEDAKKPKYNNEPTPSTNDVIARLNFGFWCHIFDAGYEQSLWIPALRFIFPNYKGKPNRSSIASTFRNLLKTRNRIAHFEPMIKDEDNLLKIYNQMIEVMNWMCPKTLNWYQSFNKFDVLYEQLANNSFI